MSNPFLLDDETGFGALPPPSNPPRSNPEAEPKRDPSSSKSSSRAGSSHRLAPDDAPSDEDVAIEVEYVEQGEDRSQMETDSIFSISTRDMKSTQ